MEEERAKEKVRSRDYTLLLHNCNDIIYFATILLYNTAIPWSRRPSARNTSDPARGPNLYAVAAILLYNSNITRLYL